MTSFWHVTEERGPSNWLGRFRCSARAHFSKERNAIRRCLVSSEAMKNLRGDSILQRTSAPCRSKSSPAMFFFFLLFFLFDRCCGGPVLTSTKAETVRFYDDKSTYTGTHAQGGPDPGRKGRGTGLSRPQRGCQTEAKVELSIETIETMTLLFLDVFFLGFTDHGFTPLVLEPFLLKRFCWKKSRTWSATTPSSQGVTNSPRDFETIMSLPSALTSVGSVDDRRGTGRVGSLSEKKIAQQLRGKDGTVEDQQLRFNMLKKHGSNEKRWLVTNIVCFAICRGL